MLVCPGCRTRTPERIDVRTLDRVGDVLACECGRRYPIVDGVPIVLPDPAAAIVDFDLAPEVAEVVVAHGSDDSPLPRLLAYLSTYLDSQWGDRATPPVDFGSRACVERIAALPRVPLAVELGCCVGRIVGEMPADHTVGIDSHFGAIRRARKLLDGERVAYNRRAIGRHYTRASIEGRTAANRELVCADALDPPLVHGAFDRVVALNMLDSVRDPRQLLSVVDGLCAVGGEVILASPFSWQSDVVAENARIGGADAAADLAAILRGGIGLGARYRLEDEADLSWPLRKDARTVVTYCTYYVRARKMSDTGSV